MMTLKQYCIKFNPSDMVRLKVIAAAQGLSVAAYLRFLTAREIRRAAKAAPRRKS
jgi:hypothetical protein